ncbi:MAG: cell division protein FtsL, partial [Rhodobacteraceae bacterium]|nr:cell division protein FtsL [Paracoccaceae bacterium]
MRGFLYALCFLSLTGMAFWAYRENYATQDALKRIAALQDDIGTLRDSLAVQRA